MTSTTRSTKAYVPRKEIPKNPEDKWLEAANRDTYWAHPFLYLDLSVPIFVEKLALPPSSFI